MIALGVLSCLNWGFYSITLAMAFGLCFTHTHTHTQVPFAIVVTVYFTVAISPRSTFHVVQQLQKVGNTTLRLYDGLQSH